MSKILKADVRRAKEAWEYAASTWGDDNLETTRLLGRFREIKAAWEAQEGKDYR